MRQLARRALLWIAPLARWRGFRRAIEAVEMFSSAIVGRGGGSSWDHTGQTKALASKIVRRDGLVVFDVGANNGAWATDLHKEITSSHPRYVLFECAPYCFEALEGRMPKLGEAQLEKYAVSDSLGEIELHVTDVGSGVASVHKRSDTSIVQYAFKTITVPTITIDHYLQEQDIKKIDVLKIDVEGHELAVLNGAKEAFRADRIALVMFEFGSANVNSRTFFRDFWNFFSEFGYVLYRVAPAGTLIPVTHYDDRMEYFRGATNYIARKEPGTAS